MGTSLTGLTPATTYDALIKVGDNAPLDGTLKTLSDGLGNDSSLSLSTGAASVTGTLAVTADTTLSGASGNRTLSIVTNTSGSPIISLNAAGDNGSTLQYVRGASSLRATMGSSLWNLVDGVGFLVTGNVGIGTSAPAAKLEVAGVSSNTDFRISRTVDATANLFISAPGGATLTSMFGISGIDIFSIDTNKFIRLTSASGGIQFNGDTAAANALDDYEEGTWTMGVSFGGASVGQTVSVNTGTYTKVGRQVTVVGLFAFASKGSSTGVARMTGLPFASANYCAAALRFNKISFTNQFQGFTDAGQTFIALEETTLLGVTTSLSDADFANDSEIMILATYFV